VHLVGLYSAGLCLFAFLQGLDLLSLPVEQSLYQHLRLLAFHSGGLPTDQPSTTALCNTHFLSCMGFHLGLLDPEKALQTLQTSVAPCPATLHHIPEQLKLKHFWILNCHCDVLSTFLADFRNIKSVSCKRKWNKSLCILKNGTTGISVFQSTWHLECERGMKLIQ